MSLKIFFVPKALLRGPLLFLRHWLRHAEVTAHNPTALISFPVVFQYDQVSAIQLRKDVVIGPFSEISVYTKSPLSNVSGQFLADESSAIGSHANIRAAGGAVYIGKNTLIGQHVSLIASNHQISSEKPHREAAWDESKTGIFIDENVWIGTHVTVLPGCSIGKNSVVGAGSIVTQSIPANEVWVGVPARKLKDINFSEKPAAKSTIFN
jgi:acetyltransferase-like isoleucine patch superfamily enzyme